MKKLLKSILFLLIILNISISIKVNASNIKLNNNTALYIWNINNLDYSGFSKLNKYLNIDTIYLGCYSNFNDYKFNLYFKFAEENNLKTFIAYGEREDEWYEDGNTDMIKHFKKIIDRVDELNKTNSYKISGIAIDSEFHSLPSYKAIKDDATKKEEFFRRYVDAIKISYEYAQSKGLEFVACIPWNYDSISEELLEELISDGCDYVQIMNYTKKNTIRNIETEITLAKKYNKKIESIAELQRPGTHGIEDITTFWNDGLDSSTENFQKMEEHYNYDNLYFTYHQIEPMLELLNNIQDFSNLYDYKIKLNYSDKNVEGENFYLVNNSEKIPGLNVYDPAIDEYYVYFYGLSFDTEYTIVDNNKKYTAEENKVNNIKSSNRKIYEEKALIDYNEETPESEDNQDNQSNKDNKGKNPGTVDNIMIYMIIAIISSIIMFYTINKLKKNFVR